WWRPAGRDRRGDQEATRMSGVDEHVVSALIEQLKTSEGRLRTQVARLTSCVEDLQRVCTMHREIAESIRALGVEADRVERSGEVVAEVAIVLESVGAEVGHALQAWRRAIDRMLSATQPIDVRTEGPRVHEWPAMPPKPD